MAGAPMKDQTQYVTIEIPGTPETAALAAFQADVEKILTQYAHTVRPKIVSTITNAPRLAEEQLKLEANARQRK